MRNISATTNSNNTSSLSSVVNFSSKAEGIAVCIGFALEAVLIVVGNLLTIFLFALNKRLRKKSLFLVINMAFADVLLGAVFLPLYVYFSVGPVYQLWTNRLDGLDIFTSYILFTFFDGICSQASLISAVLISCERFYAIFWPLKHRTLSTRAYRIVIIVGWTLAILVSTTSSLMNYFIPIKHTMYAWMSFPSIFLFIVCGCNIGIWRKFQHGNIASQQQNKASQNQRLTKTLLFVSTIAVLSWLPLIIANYLNLVHEMFIPQWNLIYGIINVINYSNSFFNRVVYALRIPQFKNSLGFLQLCLRGQAVVNGGTNKRRDNMAASLTPIMHLRTLPADSSHLQLSFKQEVMDTRL